ncbi:hypothetical protein [Ligilactobacillus ruminis]|uniref:hypothetical protein n=1 Tax=Ligilactobacillus ruminis TaxID=1623 RepID=UPI0022E9188A|nr:hypothetical protein [Ligilactobacillus ruminis]
MAKLLPFTDTLSKMQDLSVTLSDILDRLVEQYCCLKKAVFHRGLKKPNKISRKSTVFVWLFV